MRKLPRRLDIVSGQSLPKEELVRLVNKNGELSLDIEGNAPGRGSYFRYDKSKPSFPSDSSLRKARLKPINAERRAALLKELEEAYGR